MNPHVFQNPLVSVVLTNFNDAKWLREALDSCLSQTFPSFEVCAVDDGSKDSSPSILFDYAQRDNRVRAFCLSDNLGIGGARNVGIRNARGRYIAFLDSDDRFLPTSLETAVSDFERIREMRPDLSLLMYDAWLINEKGRRSGRYMARKFHGNEILEDPPLWTLPSGWFSLRERTCLFCSYYPVGEAGFFLGKMRETGSLVFCGTPNVEYRLRLRSVTTNGAAVLRALKASAETARLGCWDNPIPMDAVSPPSRQEVLAWQYGRIAKAAYVNRRLILALRAFAIVLLTNFPHAVGKGFQYLLTLRCKK